MDKIQKALKAPKGQTNAFGKYKYRSCEDIVEAVKPILAERGYSLNISDEVVMMGDRFYVKATASVMAGELGVIATACGYAREALSKKGMDESQITGAASSYARKYALNGLFAIDDTKDADTHEAEHEPAKNSIIAQQLDDISNAQNLTQLLAAFREGQQFVSGKEGEKEALKAIIDAKDKRKQELS